MVEGSGNCDNGNSELKRPPAPTKTFYKITGKKEAVPEPATVHAEEPPIPSIPPRPLLAPKLPLRPEKLLPSKQTVSSRNLFPLEDNIYTGLKPETILNKFYASGIETTITAEPITLPSDFIPKVFVNNETILGIQHGRIVQFSRKRKCLATVQDSSNRQFYELIPFNKHHNGSFQFLAFQDTGTIYKGALSIESVEFTIKILLRDAIPMGSFCKVLPRPEVDEIWVIGLRETSILLVNQNDNDVALIRRLPSHFPEAVSVTFLGPEDLAVVKSDRSIQVFSVSRHSHQPALIAKLPSIIGDLIKILKISNLNAFGTIYADGKMIIWRFEGDELVDRITVPLTLFRIQSVHISKGVLWLGLSNGKLLLIQLPNSEGKILILGEAKYHQSSLMKFLISNSSTIVTIDSSGQVCTWDQSLTFYKQSNSR